MEEKLTKLEDVQALPRDEKFFQHLVDILPLPMGIVDPSDRKILYTNNVAEKELGYERGELIGKKVPEICWEPRDSDDGFEALKEKIHLDDYEIRLKRKDGKPFFVTFYARRVICEGRYIILVIFVNITQRKESQQKASWFAKFPELDPNPIIEVDKHGKIHYINPSATALFSDLHLNGLVSDIGKFYETLKSSRKHTLSKELEVNGLWFYVQYLIRIPGRIIIYCVDITARKKFEKKIEYQAKKIEAEKRKDEALLSSIGHGIVAIDRNGKILFANKKINHFLNKKYNDLNGKNLMDVLDLYSESGRLLSHFERPMYVSLRGKTYNSKNFYCVNSQKKKIYVDVVTSPVISDRKIIGAVAVYADVTKERQIEKAKTEFVSLASHQLRTPITEISLAAEILMNGIAGPIASGQKKYLNNIKGGVREITALVEALLNITRIQMGNFVVNPKPIIMQDFLDKLISGFVMQINKKGIKLKKVFPKKEIMLNADPNILQLILENLISNAVKYTERGEIMVKLEKGEKKILITVSDTGCGIPENQKDLVFTKLFRADNILKNKTKGHGLGLHIVKSIVQKIGGKITFESEEKRGTVFYVALPLSGMKKKVQQSLI